MINTIRSLKAKNSAGYDDISSKLLKLCENELSNPLVDIVNKSFRTGVFPSALKMAKVYPKFKKGPTTEAANYRPISLIPPFSKIIVKIVLTRLFDLLNTFQLLTPNQHGFLAEKSTTTALINLIEFLLDQTEEGNTATAILLDYSKAFDCLDHEYLLTKLTTFGIQGSSKSWFTSYLTERTQKVTIKQVQNGRTNIVTSDAKPITRGVPQGSVLGPILFILYTNDFPQFIQRYSDTLMYADDTVLLLGRPRPEHLDIDSFVALNMAIQYCHNNDLVVNETKTQQLILGRQKQDVSGLPGLGEISSCRYLGVTLDDKLSWRPHVDTLCRRLSSGLYVIRRIKNTSDSDTAKIAYHALFETHLCYGIAVWGGTTMGNLQRVLVQQKRAVRSLKGLEPRASCREAFRELKIMTVINLYILEVVSYVHIKMPTTVRSGVQIHQYNTRHATNYCLPVHTHASTEKKPSYIGAKIWNSLPEALKRTDRQRFRKDLRAWLQDNPFYTITEFFEWRPQNNP